MEFNFYRNKIQTDSKWILNANIFLTKFNYYPIKI